MQEGKIVNSDSDYSSRSFLIALSYLLFSVRARFDSPKICLFLPSTDPQAMFGRGGGGGGRGGGGGGRRSDSRPDHSSLAPDQSANRGGRGGRGKGYGSPDAGGSRPAP